VEKSSLQLKTLQQQLDICTQECDNWKDKYKEVYNSYMSLIEDANPTIITAEQIIDGIASWNLKLNLAEVTLSDCFKINKALASFMMDLNTIMYAAQKK
jgi:hypothetical protein